mgnify:CR=1 FL=1
MSHSLFLLPHIPRTGGTYLSSVLQVHAGNTLDRCDNQFPLRGATPCVPNAGVVKWAAIRETEGKVPSIIRGHHTAGTYSVVFPEAFLGMWFRDPVSRICSHWWYMQTGKASPALQRDIDEGKLIDRWQFICDPRIRNLQSLYVDDLPIGDFDFVGVVEEWARSHALFQAVTGFRYPECGYMGDNVNRINDYAMSAECRASVEKIHAEDMDLYARIKERFYADCEKHGV